MSEKGFSLFPIIQWELESLSFSTWFCGSQRSALLSRNSVNGAVPSAVSLIGLHVSLHATQGLSTFVKVLFINTLN